MQLRRDALPALEKAGVGLAVVGIGSLDAGETFASRTEFPKSMLYVDDSDESEAYRAAGTRNTKRKPDGKADFEGIGSMWSQSTNDALKARGKADLDAITGYSVIRAESLDEAEEVARGNPFIAGIRVYEISEE